MSLLKTAKTQYLSLGIGFTGDITKKDEVSNYLSNQLGVTIAKGQNNRLSQAYITPEDYIADKEAIIKAIVEGAEGGKNELKLALPGMADKSIPKMTGLDDEFKNYAISLTAQGIPKDMAMREAEAYVRDLYQLRIKQFATSFPGMMDNAMISTLDNVKVNKEFNLKKVGFNK